MWLPALEQNILRNAAGEVQYPLPGLSGVTEVFKEASIGKGSKVLEIAASVGAVAMLAAKVSGPTGESHLAQLRADLVEVAKANITKYGMDKAIKVSYATKEHVPYPANYFDVVISDRALACLY